MVDLVIAGRRIRLCSREEVTISPDERFMAFMVPPPVSLAVQREMLIETMPGAMSLTNPGLIDTGIPFWTPVAVSDLTTETEPGPTAGKGSAFAAGEGSDLAAGNGSDLAAGKGSDLAAGKGSDPAGDTDLIVDVEPGPGEVPAGAVKVFDAQLMEEVPGGVINSGEPFWEVFSGEGVTCARVFLKGPERNALLVMPHGERRWRIYTGEVAGSATRAGSSIPAGSGRSGSDNPAGTRGSGNREETLPAETSIEVNPLPWPLDGLLLYFLFSRAGDIMIHGSGVISGGKGWLFSGRSGSGKTTLARIFDRAGDRVIHDDRLVLRREGGRWVMHNTPVYRNDEPRSAVLDHLWLIKHGQANVSEPLAGAEAVAMILANCIQQNWESEAAARLAAAADELASSVRVSRLSFLPDGTVRDYLRLRKEEEITIAADAAEALLSAGRNITVTAGGYSMWPAIRPGDAVVISPCDGGAAAAGQVVALRRDGGFVLHRVTGVITAGGRKLIRTRADEPAGPETIAGVVLSVSRSGRQLAPPRRRSPRWLNRLGAGVCRLVK